MNKQEINKNMSEVQAAFSRHRPAHVLLHIELHLTAAASGSFLGGSSPRQSFWVGDNELWREGWNRS